MKCVKCKSTQIYVELHEHIQDVKTSYCMKCWQAWLKEFRGEE